MLNFMLFLFVMVESKYKTTFSIQTPFKNEKKLFNYILSCKFFKKYLDNVSAEEIIFSPSVENKILINNNQNIEYKYKPVITMLPLLPLKKIKIIHHWKIYTNELIGNINSFYICFDMKIYSRQIKDNLFLIFDAEIVNKKFFIPNIALKYALMDFGNDFLKILNN